MSLVVKTDVLKNIPLDRLPYFISADRFLNRWIACHGRLFYDGESIWRFIIAMTVEPLKTVTGWFLGIKSATCLISLLLRFKRKLESLIKSKKNALQDIAYFSALENEDMKNRFKVLAQYIFITRLSKLSNVYYVLLIMLGTDSIVFINC